MEMLLIITTMFWVLLIRSDFISNLNLAEIEGDHYIHHENCFVSLQKVAIWD